MAHSPTKSDFHLGKRFSRLFPQTHTQGRGTNGSGASQKLLQHLSGIHRIYIPLAPILCFWNLRIQHRAVLSDVFALFAADFFCDFRIPSAFGIIKHIKVNAVSLALVDLLTASTAYQTRELAPPRSPLPSPTELKFWQGLPKVRGAGRWKSPFCP